MSQVVVDTDVASYIFNWHPSAERYLDTLRGSEWVLSFMTVAEMRMGLNGHSRPSEHGCAVHDLRIVGDCLGHLLYCYSSRAGASNGL